MFDGYSKQVKHIETSASDEDKMLNVVLLSQKYLKGKYTHYVRP